MSTNSNKETVQSATTAASSAAVVAPAGDAASAAANGNESAANKALFHLAFKRVEAEIRAVPLERLMALNFDARAVVTTIVGVYPGILALRPQIVAELSHFDISVVDKLKDYALALGHAHARYMLTTEASDELVGLSEEGVVVRDQLQTDALALSKRGLLKAELVAKLHNGNGYKNIAFDLVGLVELFMDAWPSINSKVAFTLEELERARVIGNGMIELLGLREQGPAARSKVGIVRQQAYVLCADAYDEVRHAARFVRRREEDADSIVPPLFAGRTRRGSAPKEPEFTQAGAPVAGQAGPAVGAQAPTTSAPSIPVGHPGSSPFAR